MSRPLHVALLCVAGLVLLLLGSFGAARALGAGTVLGEVDAGGVSLGGLDAEEARQALEQHQAELLARPVTFRVGGSAARLQPERVGFALDVDAVVGEAMQVGRTGSPFQQLRWWLSHLFSNQDIPLRGSLSDEALSAVLSEWDEIHIADPPFPGAVEVRGTTPVPVYPRSGRRIDPEQASRLVLDAILDGDGDPPPLLPVVTEQPRLRSTDVDRAVEQAELWLSAPVTLVGDDGEVEAAFSVEDLAAALRSQATDEPRLVLTFDPAVVGEALERVRTEVESPPVDASFHIEGYQVEVVPGRAGTLIDVDATVASLESAASSSTRRAPLPLREGAEPEVTTEELESLGIRHLVSSFTTYHDCCGNRVTNIHLFADSVDGAIVRPGETFGLNAHVGERTAEKGYLEDGTIIRGELVETVGGGVSQFATTFYNAVFWGGYEDVAHKPHSFYFSRYPEGIEATISWPLPELEFRNDSSSAILIRTEYTDTSITVRFYGDNDGRILVGAHRNGNTDIDVVAEGGPEARVVAAQVSGRYAFSEPNTEYRADPSLEPDQQRQVQSPSQGWTVTVTRTVTVGGQSRVREWQVRYLPRREILEVHPCRIPGSTQTCPTTTTTTTTTTTLPPAPGEPPTEPGSPSGAPPSRGASGRSGRSRRSPRRWRQPTPCPSRPDAGWRRCST